MISLIGAAVYQGWMTPLLFLAALASTPQFPPSQVEAKARVVACGLPAGKVEAKDESELQESILRVGAIGDPSDEQLGCVARASLATVSYVFFDEPVQSRYWPIFWDLEKKAGLAAARDWLKERGLLDRLPAFDPRTIGLAEHAGRLERFCGVKPGTMLEVLEGSLIFRPDYFQRLHIPPSEEFSRAFECIENAGAASGVEIVMIGNAADPPAAEPKR